jgi:hypothetical protein
VPYDENFLITQVKRIIEEQMTENVVSNGQVGLGQILVPFLKESKMIVCTDKSRKVFSSKDAGNNLIRDKESKNFIKKIYPYAETKSTSVYKNDAEKRKKPFDMHQIKKQIREYETEIESKENFLKSQKSNSNDYKKTLNEIRNTNQKLEEYHKKLLKLEQEDILENRDPESQNNYPLINGHCDIVNLKNKPTGFVKVLSKEL